ncbi:Long-chain base-1-phosphate phosphatase [Saitoella coloradoensis]
MRTPILDVYFSYTALLGTHTFFMMFLPIIFWCGYTNFARAMIHVLAAGVFFSGMLKDYLCLPRPLSPPLERLNMSHSTALEYGFPSTHSTNAVSVALYALSTLASCGEDDLSPKVALGLKLVAVIYGVSVVFGRLYCGMHGFFDVMVGTGLGALIWWLRWTFRVQLDTFVYEGGWQVPFILIPLILILVRIHPEPADSCPCFDDGVAFAAVVLGVDIGVWVFANSNFAWSSPSPATVPYLFSDLGLSKSALRIILGVILIFIWRAIAKPTLHAVLPPVFRRLETLGLDLPRAHFISASTYKHVPANIPGDTLPGVDEIKESIRSIGRRRGASVGPQSQADFYEAIDYRERQRRKSSVDGKVGESIQADLDKYIKENEELLKSIERPRVRYDVEVVTKLIVYAGIGYIAIPITPFVFAFLGLNPA